jgi:hypothetical protein
MHLKVISLFMLTALFSSCFGVKTDVLIRKDLSGTVTITYTVSEDMAALGELDGNAGWPFIPVGKADMERGAARIAGLSLRSFNEKREGKNRILTASLSFDHIEALVDFMNGGPRAGSSLAGSGVFLTGDGGGGQNRKLSFVLTDGSSVADGELSFLAREAFEGYRFELTVSTPQGQKTYNAEMANLVTTTEKTTFEAAF